MPVRVLFPIQTNRIGRFNQCPFQIMVDVGSQMPVSRATPAGVYPRTVPPYAATLSARANRATSPSYDKYQN